VKVDDFKFALRNDHRKLGRVEELLVLQREINEARKTFDNSEGKSLSRSYVEKTEDRDEKRKLKSKKTKT
jgi:transcription initiation factor TFIID subunit 13